MHTTSASPASAASMIASAAKGGGTKITVAFAPVAFTPCATVSNTGRSKCFCPPLPGVIAAHHFGPVGDRLLGVKGAFPAREALNQQPCIFVDQNAHAALPCAAFTTFSAASRMPSATVKFNPESIRIFRPSSTLVPSMRTTIGTLTLSSRAAVNHAGRQRIAAQNAAENIDQHRLHCFVR